MFRRAILLLAFPLPLCAQSADLAPILKRLETGLYAADLEPALAELEQKAPGDPAARDAARKALEANRDRKAEAFRKDLLRRLPSHLPALRAELDRLRGAALTLIFNPAAYPDADHGAAGQPKVDEAVAAVRALWDDPYSRVVAKDASLQKSEEILRTISGKLLPSIGGAAPAGGPPLPPDESAWLRSICPGDPDTLRRVWSTPLTTKEKEWAAWNDRVAAWNAKTPGVAENARELVRILNDYRAVMGVHALEIDARLVTAAVKHAAAMAKEGKIWHDGSDGTPVQRIRREGYPQGASGENVAEGAGTPEEAHRAWFHSSGHHRNMLSSLWSQIGAGEKDGFWTQDFGNAKPASGNAPPRLPFAADKTGQ